jgi:hypothetical protein
MGTKGVSLSYIVYQGSQYYIIIHVHCNSLNTHAGLRMLLRIEVSMGGLHALGAYESC